MLDRKLSIFRKEALDRLSSPERLDELVEVVDPHSWMTLVAAAALIAVALVWSVVGRLPSTVTGRGVLIRPRKVVELQPAGSGRLTALNVRVGDSVGKGTVLGTIDQAELRQELQQQPTIDGLLTRLAGRRSGGSRVGSDRSSDRGRLARLASAVRGVTAEPLGDLHPGVQVRDLGPARLRSRRLTLG